MRTIEKHQQFLAAASQNSLNTTQPYNDGVYSGEHRTVADSMRKSRERDSGGGYFDDLPTDIKQLRSLQPTAQLQSAGQHRSRYEGHSHGVSGSHVHVPYGEDADSHQEDGESQQSQPSYAAALDSSRHAASLPSSIVSGGGGATQADQHHHASYRPSSAGGAVNTSQSHMDYFRSDVSKALFDQTGGVPLRCSSSPCTRTGTWINTHTMIRHRNHQHHCRTYRQNIVFTGSEGIQFIVELLDAIFKVQFRLIQFPLGAFDFLLFHRQLLFQVLASTQLYIRTVRIFHSSDDSTGEWLT